MRRSRSIHALGAALLFALPLPASAQLIRGESPAGGAAGVTQVYGATPTALAAPLTMYLDPVAGVDSGTCTVGSPCQTIAYAKQNIPKHLAYGVTINLAGGTYNEFAVFDYIDGGAGVASTITLQGSTWTAFVPTTGPSTGAFTSAAGRVATMATATWTVNNLAGSHVKITSGTKSGNYYPILLNTATGITLPLVAADMTAIATATFELVRPAAIISHAAVAGVNALITNSGSAPLVLNAVDIVGVHFTESILLGAASSVTVQNCRMSTTPIAYTIYGPSTTASATVTNTYVNAGNTSGLLVGSATLANSVVGGTATISISAIARLATTEVLVTGASQGIALIDTYGGAVSLSLIGYDFLRSGGTAVNASGYTTLALSVVRGTWPTVTVGIYLDGVKARVTVQDVVITSSTDGIRVATSGNDIALGGTASITATAYAVNLAYSNTSTKSFSAGAINNVMVGASAALSGGTADINLGGGTTTSLVALRAVPNKTILDATTLNRAMGY